MALGIFSLERKSNFLIKTGKMQTHPGVLITTGMNSIKQNYQNSSLDRQAQPQDSLNLIKQVCPCTDIKHGTF